MSHAARRLTEICLTGNSQRVRSAHKTHEASLQLQNGSFQMLTFLKIIPKFNCGIKTGQYFILCKIIFLLNFSTLYLWAGIAQWYNARLRAGWSGVRVPTGGGNSSLHHHPASYSRGTRGSFPGGKATEAWNWPLISTSAEVKNVWRYISTPPTRLPGVVLS
jgi:hypothetical protein